MSFKYVISSRVYGCLSGVHTHGGDNPCLSKKKSPDGRCGWPVPRRGKLWPDRAWCCRSRAGVPPRHHRHGQPRQKRERPSTWPLEGVCRVQPRGAARIEKLRLVHVAVPANTGSKRAEEANDVVPADTKVYAYYVIGSIEFRPYQGSCAMTANASFHGPGARTY